MNTLLRWTCLLAAFGCLSGCATMSNVKTAHVTILSTGKASVDGSTVEIAKLGKKLQSLGATPNTTIMVAVPADVSMATLADVKLVLNSAGFGKILFKKPLEKSATVTDKSAPGQTAPIPPAKPTKTRKSTSQKPVRSGTL